MAESCSWEIYRLSAVITGPPHPAAAALAALAMLGLAACGGATKNSSSLTTTSGPGSAAKAFVAAPPPSSTQVFQLRLTGAQVPNGGIGEAGAAGASASATIRIVDSKSEICWHFGKLVAVPHPTIASLNGAVAGTDGALVANLGPRYRPTGCTALPAYAVVGIAGAAGRNASRYYVEVASKAYPTGAIRGQLSAG